MKNHQETIQNQQGTVDLEVEQNVFEHPDLADEWLDEGVTGTKLSFGTDSNRAAEPLPPKSLEEYKAAVPEFIANPALENTTYVNSIALKGEWRNGQLLRTLDGMFRQQTKPGETAEVQIVANVGKTLDNLVVKDRGDPQHDQNGDYILQPRTRDNQEQHALLDEMDEAVDYLKTAVKVQGLARQNTQDAQAELQSILDQTTNPIQRSVLEQAVKNKDNVALVVVDATHAIFNNTTYKDDEISAFRTLGVDFVEARHGERAKDVVVNLFDADTVMSNTRAFRDMQTLFDKNPNLNYVFLGLTNTPAGHEANFIADAPRANLRRTLAYNLTEGHGSPQIAFRLSAYQKLEEIRGYNEAGFHGDEDRDTARRLVYHFGSIQDGLLFEEGAYLPVTMTADRVDGHVDSVSRAEEFAKSGVQEMAKDMKNVFTVRDALVDVVANLEPTKRAEALAMLEKARLHYAKEEKVQQRFNRLVLGEFMNAVAEGYITYADGELSINSEGIGGLKAADAMRHYLAANEEVVKEVLSSQDDQDTIRYLLGRTPELPEGKTSLTPFQTAIREYIGEPMSIEEVEGWDGQDPRSVDSKSSMMHTLVSEMLALGYVRGMYVEAEQFEKSRETDFRWPKNRDEQKLRKRFGSLAMRVEAIKAVIPNIDEVEIKSFPALTFYQRLRKVVRFSRTS